MLRYIRLTAKSYVGLVASQGRVLRQSPAACGSRRGGRVIRVVVRHAISRLRRVLLQAPTAAAGVFATLLMFVSRAVGRAERVLLQSLTA